jgi:hypothetical protein
MLNARPFPVQLCTYVECLSTALFTKINAPFFVVSGSLPPKNPGTWRLKQKTRLTTYISHLPIADSVLAMAPDSRSKTMANVSGYSDTVESGMTNVSGVHPPANGAPPPVGTNLKVVDTRPWYKQPKKLYTIAVVVILASMALAAVAALLGTGVIGNMGGSNSSSGANSPGDGQDSGPTPAPSYAEDTPPPFNAGDTSAPSNEGDTSAPTAALKPASSPDISSTNPAPTTSPTQEATEVQRTDPLSFYVMGDVPYSDAEAPILFDQMTNMTLNRRPGAAFMVHVGDMMKGLRTLCEESYYLLVKNILFQSPLPPFVLSGDNDYLDCPDPELGWSYYLNSFVDFEQEWSTVLPAGVPLLNVTRWTEEVAVVANVTTSNVTTSRPEMFKFVEDGILFMSLTVMNMPEGVSPDALFYERLNHSKTWVETALSEKGSAQLRGVVMFGHALIGDPLIPFFGELKDTFYANLIYVPTLYVHGDGHEFHIALNMGESFNWTSFTDVQVEQGALADPLLIEVATLVNGIMSPLLQENAMQTVLAGGLFRVDQQNGCYDLNEC